MVSLQNVTTVNLKKKNYHRNLKMNKIKMKNNNRNEKRMNWIIAKIGVLLYIP